MRAVEGLEDGKTANFAGRHVLFPAGERARILVSSQLLNSHDSSRPCEESPRGRGMSQLLIQHYLNELSDLRRVSGSARESVVREAFKTLLKNWGKSRDLIFIPEYEYTTLQKTRVYPDGALLYSLRVPLGYWEAKDEDDDLDKEIDKKFRKG